MDDRVAKLGGWDQLSPEEKVIYEEHLKVIEDTPITVESTRAFTRRMIAAIERNLVDTEENSKDSVGLKARLKNALVLEAYLISPEKAKEARAKLYPQNG